MPQLARTRVGWENEHLATFLLSQIAFVAQPVTISDDIGSDLICTVFESRSSGSNRGGDLLFPRNSFAIQIKTSGGPIDATNKIDYLFHLEIPFLVGIVGADRSRPTLSIYSG